MTKIFFSVAFLVENKCKKNRFVEEKKDTEVKSKVEIEFIREINIFFLWESWMYQKGEHKKCHE